MFSQTFWTAIGSLAAVAGAFFAARQLGQRKEAPDYTVEGEKWVFERGWSYDDLLQRLINLDYLTLAGVELTTQDEGTVEQWAPVFQKSPQTWALIVYKKKKIVGYWSYFSVSEKLAQRIEAGELRDCEIISEEVRSINENGNHVLYFGMIARDPDMTEKGGRAFKKLLGSLLSSLQFFIDRKDVIRAYAVCFTPEAERLCLQFKLEPRGNTKSGRPLYVAKPGGFDHRKLKRYASATPLPPPPR
jgi:hypothetical protein